MIKSVAHNKKANNPKTRYYLAGIHIPRKYAPQMWRDHGVRRARGGDDEKAANKPCENQCKVIPHKVDWEEQWPKRGEPSERNMRVMIADNEEWGIWKYNSPRATKDSVNSSNTR